MSNMRYYSLPIFAISVSFFGLFTVLVIAINPPMIYESFLWRKPLIGSVFSLICILGTFAALFPRQCSRTFHFRKENMSLTSHQIHSSSHHPDCGKFSAHVIRVGNYTLCAACTGLLLGAIIALVGTTFYFFNGRNVEGVSFSVVLIGTAGIILGFLQLKFRGFLRLLLNTFFVLGAFLILVGIDELAESLFADFFLTALIAFWILTRIQLSQWDHWRICSNCESRCEVWEAKKNRD
jgi:hypothetical protein